jgi:hypothetical protein
MLISLLVSVCCRKCSYDPSSYGYVLYCDGVTYVVCYLWLLYRDCYVTNQLRCYPDAINQVTIVVFLFVFFKL